MLGASSIEEARENGALDLNSAQKATVEILSANQIAPAPRKNSRSAIEQPRAAEVLSPGVIYTASANCTGQNPRPYNVCLDIEITEAVGHQHTADMPPVEFFERHCHLQVPGNQQVLWPWRSPYFASRLKVTFLYSGWCQGENVETLDSGVTELVEIIPGPDYSLVGSTPSHRFNHFGRSEALEALKKIAADYRRDFPKNSKIAINDISLMWGGLFDIKSDWNPPHQSHRWGYQADVRITNIPAGDQAALKKIMENNGARVLIETNPPHFHLDFTPKDSPHYEEALVCDYYHDSQ